MFSRKKLIAIMLCAIFSCGLFCSSYLTSSAEAKTISSDVNIVVPDDDLDSPSDIENEDNNTGKDDNNNNDANNDSNTPTNPKDPSDNPSPNPDNPNVDEYLTEIKNYRNGYTAYNGAVKYLQKLQSYQINSIGYLVCTLFGQSLDGSLNFKTIKSGEDFYNLFSINTSMFNVNIQAKNNTNSVVCRYNQVESITDGYYNWKKNAYNDNYKLFKRYIVAGDVNKDTAVISGFRKTSTGYKFVVTLNYSDLLESISRMVKEIGNTDIGLTFESATIEFNLNKYGAPVSAKYQYTGKATYRGFTAPASVTLIEKYGNFNKNIKVDTATFGNAPA